MAQVSPTVRERADVLAHVAGPPVDRDAMAVGSSIWRAAQAMRTHLEHTVLRADDLSWTGFSLLFHLWVSEAMETRALAASIGVSRATVSGVCDTLERRGLARRAGHERDRRLVRLELTPAGRALIEELFPRFNEGESALCGDLTADERRTLASLLRRVVLTATRERADG